MLNDDLDPTNDNLDEPDPDEEDGESIQMVAITGSSNLLSAGYSKTRAILLIEYRAGKTYRWDQIPQAVYDGLMAAASPGQYAHREISARFGKGTPI